MRSSEPERDGGLISKLQLGAAVRTENQTVLLCESGGCHPVFTCLICHTTFLSLSRVSDPFLHGAFAVQYVAWRTLPLELHHSVDQHQQAQRQHTGDDDGDGLHRARLVVQLDHHVGVAVVGWRSGGVNGCQLTAHEVLQDGARVARLHSEELVVELPILLPFVEVSET